MSGHAGSTIGRQPKVITPPAVSSRAWMIIFTDLVSLMLTFFVMLFAMTSVKPDRWDETVDSLSRTLSPERPAVSVPATSRFNIATTLRKRAVNLDLPGGRVDPDGHRRPHTRPCAAGGRR